MMETKLDRSTLSTSSEFLGAYMVSDLATVDGTRTDPLIDTLSANHEVWSLIVRLILLEEKDLYILAILSLVP